MPVFPGSILNNALVQTPQQLVPPASVPAALDLDDIQGDILIGLQKKAQRFVFFQIDDLAAFKVFLRAIILPKIVSCAEAHKREGELRDSKVDKAKAPDPSTDWQALVPISAVNLAFTFRGLSKLLSPGDLSGIAPSLTKSALDIATTCGDPVAPNAERPADWQPDFNHDVIDGVLNIAGSSRDEVDKTWERLRLRLENTLTDVWPNGAVGDVRPGRFDGHEHFGWKDGVSQPAVDGLADPFPGQISVPPGAFVLGAPGATVPLPANLAWMANGSFMVFRKLEQDVAAFENFVADEALRLGMDSGLLAARMIGRWKSGAPLALAPLADDAVLGSRADHNNDFDFKDDPHQRRCPYGAHIRKTNPRADLDPSGGVGNQRIMRQGIPYGREHADDPGGARGLLFVCYQADIPTQFERQQKDWANDPGFVEGKTRPPSRGGALVRPGLDPIIGQVGTPQSGAQPAPLYPQQAVFPEQQCTGMDEPLPNYPSGSAQSSLPANVLPRFVIPRAGVYLFAPSIAALGTKLST